MNDRVWRALALGAALALVGMSTSAVPRALGRDDTVIDRMAFTSNRAGTAQIYVMNEDGSDQKRLTDSAPFDDMQPAWSPDGTRIAFTRGIGYQSANLGASSIVVMDAGGGNERVLANEQGINLKPAWSPDGRRILYAHGSPTQSPFEIWVMNADGTDKHAVPNSKDAYPAAWSPDGSRIVFNRAVDVWVMNDDGTNQSRLTTTGNNYTPSWAPSERIVFTSTRDGAGKQVYSMDPDGKNQARLVDDGSENKFPAWSPDGLRIAYSRSTIPCDGPECGLTQIGGYEIYSMNADGSDQTRITNTTPPGREFGEGYPAYAPRVRTPAGSRARSSTVTTGMPGLASSGVGTQPVALTATAFVVGGWVLRRLAAKSRSPR
jgi:Tol biopolymer transport system component